MVLTIKALDRAVVVTIPAVVVAQVWRGNRPIISRLLRACDIEGLDEAGAKRAGVLVARGRTSDIVDAIVVVGAVARGDSILTSDPDDIRRLVVAAGSKAHVLAI